MLSTSLEQNTLGTLPAALVVEDNRLSRQCLARLFQYSGIEVDSANTVSLALEKLDRNPRIVLLDVDLPDGSGSEILAHIRRHRLPIKVCVVTGSVGSSHFLEGLNPDAIFVKPYHAEDILRWVAQAMLVG